MAKWKDVEIVHTDEKTDLRVAYLKDPDDRLVWGRLMGHCGGRHTFFTNAGWWHFFTVLDKKDEPHTSIHARITEVPSDKEFSALKKEHPEWDFYVVHTCNGYEYGGRGWTQAEHVPLDGQGDLEPEPAAKYSDEWYDWRSRVGPRKFGQIPFDFKGTPLVIVSATVRGQYERNSGEYTRVMKEWYEAHKLADHPPAPMGC